MDDPEQLHPIDDPELELRMLNLLAELMRASDAPASQFARLGIPVDGDASEAHLLVAAQAERAAALAEPIPPIDELPASDLLTQPLLALMTDPRIRDVIQSVMPQAGQTEMVAMSPTLSLVDLARFALFPAAALRAIGARLEEAVLIPTE